MGRVLIVDDEPGIRDALEALLSARGHAVQVSATVVAAQEVLNRQPLDLVITDLRLAPDGDGLDVLRAAMECKTPPEVIVMTAFGTREKAQQAIGEGATFYLEKSPHLAKDVEVLANQAIEKRKLQAENAALRGALLGASRSGIIGRSPAIKEVLDLVDRIAGLRTTALVMGESGTGKERIARALHEGAPWSEGPFIPLNCGALPESLMESELFGYVQGAFTGADDDKVGVFEAARGGTLFLDEIGEMPVLLQPKLLRVLQEKKVRRLGSTQEIPLEDVRLIAATNRDLEAEVAAGRFREDLFFRLNVVQLELPPLRERPEDIVVLAEHFLEKFARIHRRPVRRIESSALDCLTRFKFPGNVRQLENLIERGVALALGEQLTLQDLPPALREQSAPPPPVARSEALPSFPSSGVDLEELVDAFERKWIDEALQQADGVKTKAAELLGLSFRQFRYKLSKIRDKDRRQGVSS